MVVVSRSIIWSPHEGQNQFLAGGTELKLYEWVPEVCWCWNSCFIVYINF